MRCPPIDVLEHALREDQPAGELRAHLEECSRCRGRAQDVRNNVALADRLRLAAGERAPTLSGAIGRALTGDVHPGRIEDYAILREIHRGGQGVVFRALHTPTKREVAIKMLLHGRLATVKQQARFEREIELAAALRHPGIVTIYDSGRTADGRHYFAMELVDGVPLDEAVRGMPIRSILALFAQICDGVHYAHQRGVIHRDLKPSNVLVERSGEPRILDFGLAKAADPSASLTQTHAGDFLGTPMYAAPEQFKSAADVIDTRTDVYSIGVMLYIALAGRHPQKATNLVDLMRSIESHVPDAPSKHNGDVDQDADAIVLKALEIEPQNRYESAAALAADLRRYLAGEALQARGHSGWYVLKKTVRRYRLAFTIAAASGVALLAVATLMTLLYQQARAAKNATESKAAELARAQSLGNIEHGRLAAASGSVALAEQLLWSEFLTQPSGSELERQAHWALREFYAAQPCSAARYLSTNGCVKATFACTAGGDQLVAACASGTVLRYSLPDLRMVEAQRIPEFEVADAIALSPDATRVAVWKTPQLDLYDLATGKLVSGVTLVNEQYRFATFRPDNARLAVILSDRVCVYDAANGAPLAELRPGSGPITSLVFSPAGDQIALTSGSALHLYEFATDSAQPTAHRLRTDFAPSPSWNGLRFSADGARLAFNIGAEIIVVDTPDLTHDRHWSGMSATEITKTFSPDGARLAVASESALVTVWDLTSESPQPPRSFIGDRPTTHLVFTHDGRSLIGSQENGLLRVWELDSRAMTRIPTPDSGRLHVTFDPHRSEWICCDPSGLSFYESACGAPRERVEHLTCGSVSCAAITHDGRFIAVAAYDGSVRVLQRDNLSETCTLIQPGRMTWDDAPLPYAANFVSFSSDDRLLAACNDRSEVLVFDMLDGRGALRQPIALEHAQRVPAVAFGPNDGQLASIGRDGWLILWDIQTMKPRLRIHADETRGRTLDFSPDGRFIATGGDDGTIRIWDAASGTLVRRLAGHQQGVFRVQFSHDGTLLASGGQMGMDREAAAVMIWDVRNGRNLQRLYGHTHAVFSVSFSSDDRRVASTSSDCTLLVHDLEYFDRHIAGNLDAAVDRLGDRVSADRVRALHQSMDGIHDEASPSPPR